MTYNNGSGDGRPNPLSALPWSLLSSFVSSARVFFKEGITRTMATGVAYPTTDHVSGDFSTGVHERAEGQDIDPTAVRRQALLEELKSLGVEVPSGETDEERAARLLDELATMDQGADAAPAADATPAPGA